MVSIWQHAGANDGHANRPLFFFFWGKLQQKPANGQAQLLSHKPISTYARFLQTNPGTNVLRYTCCLIGATIGNPGREGFKSSEVDIVSFLVCAFEDMVTIKA